MITTYIDIGILVGLLALSSFFSAAEMALFSLNPIKVRHMMQRNLRGAKIIETLKNEPQELLITLLIGNNVVNIFAASFATAVAINLFGSAGIGIATGVMTFFLLVFGEIMPKSVAATHNQRIALFVARPVQFFRFVLTPLVFILKFSVNWLVKKKTEAHISEAEIRTAASLAFEVGVVEKDEKEMIENVFKLNDTYARHIMTPLGKVAVLSVDAKAKETLAIFKKQGFSRLPIYEKKKKNIIGIVHIKDIVHELDKKEFNLRNILFMPLVCEMNDRADHLLHRFRNRQQHFALVKDHNDQTVGIVTLEDVLEELVGEIEDESDSQSES